jgi:hypothetical protein
MSLASHVNVSVRGAVAAARNRWEFMLTTCPLPIPNDTGSPVNPIGVFSKEF